MKILLDVQNQQLILTVADVEGVPLFPLMLQLKRNNFRESKLMLMINELTEQLTGIQGILGSTIAFTLKQPKRRKIIRYRILEASPSNAFNQAAQLAIRNVNLNPLPEALAGNPPYIVVVKVIPQLQ